MAAATLVKPGSKVRLKDHDPEATLGFTDKAEATKVLDDDREAMRDLQERLYAENRRALLVVLQAMDTGGKDGTIKSVLSGLNPSGGRDRELQGTVGGRTRSRLPLARATSASRGFGNIGIFNRSHYEDVLIRQGRALVPPKEIERRYDVIIASKKTSWIPGRRCSSSSSTSRKTNRSAA